ncbi:DUF106 domain-containing protein [Halorussus halobius]|uniref:DUF106 domain-containing protein n=1 Tax=Halorussus halobius TaxID=1710537 RepID=UPI0010919B47|nr:EMC3/TMCO1 family protein [Halorussus halobius]
MATESRGWSRYDKLAGLASLALLSGYYVTPIQEAVGVAMQALLGPATTVLPFSVLILLLAGTTGLSSALLNLKLRNQDRMDELRDRMNDLRDRMESARERDDDDAVEELQTEQQELMVDWMTAMKSQFRPAVWSMLVTVPAFLYLRWLFLAPTAAIAPAAFAVPMLGHVAWTATLVGPVQVWLAWYVGCSISTGLVARKVVSRVV